MERLTEAERAIIKIKETAHNKERFIAVIDSITGIAELTPELLNSLVERIEIHERTPPKARTGYTQEIDIYFKFVGKLN